MKVQFMKFQGNEGLGDDVQVNEGSGYSGSV